MKNTLLFIVVAGLVLGCTSTPPYEYVDDHPHGRPEIIYHGVVELTLANFDELVTRDRAWFIEFYAPWCAWCRRLAPIFKELGELVGHEHEVLNIGKFDITKDESIPTKYKVMGLPTMLLFKVNGEVVEYSGERTKEAMIAWLENEIGSKL